MLTYNGGPAFPMTMRVTADAVDGKTVNEVATMGMNMRDYFAARAMQAMAAGLVKELCSPLTTEPKATLRALSDVAYMVADAMLSAREVKP